MVSSISRRMPGRPEKRVSREEKEQVNITSGILNSKSEGAGISRFFVNLE